jgi:hypothetical protein
VLDGATRVADLTVSIRPEWCPREPFLRIRPELGYDRDHIEVRRNVATDSQNRRSRIEKKKFRKLLVTVRGPGGCCLRNAQSESTRKVSPEFLAHDGGSDQMELIRVPRRIVTMRYGPPK